MLESDVDQWCRYTGPRVLQNIGITPGLTLVDLGSRMGRYTLPAARIIRSGGRAIGVDKDIGSLAQLKYRAVERGLNNVHTIQADILSDGLPFASETVDFVLLFDVLHGGYCPEPGPRVKLFGDVRRILKASGIMAVYPTHTRQHGPPSRHLELEITNAGFEEITRRQHRLLHDDRLVRGRVIAYRPTTVGRPADGDSNN